MNRKNLLLLFFSLLSFSGFCQYKTKQEPSAQSAKDNLSLGNYSAALKEYLLLYKSDTANPLYNFRIGLSYLKTNIDKAKAIPYLEAAAASASHKKEALRELARAYHFAYRFDEAIETFNAFKEVSGNAPKSLMEEVNREMETCYSARELYKYPLDVTFENPGKEVNTAFPDYYPFITENESQLIFTSRRKGTLGGYESFDGYFTSDIFMCPEKGGKWAKAKNAGPSVNSSGDDEAVSISPDGSALFIYSENDFDYGDILLSVKKGKTLQKRNLLDLPVNTPDLEVGASATEDGNALFFASNRTGTLGQLDIYMAKKLPNGQWGDPVNLGEAVNTPFNEDFPSISKDGKTLYFASQGHSGMGGFDIFKSIYNEQTNTWGRAINIGYPINTPEDNMTISFSRNGKYAYLSALRKEGLGDLDIYRVSFNTVEPDNSVIKGIIQTQIPIDYNKYKNIHYYKNGEAIKGFPDEYRPAEPWQFVETKKIQVKEGYDHRFILTFDKDGTQKSFDAKFLPKDDSTLVFKDVKTIENKKANYVAPANRPVYKTAPVEAAMVNLYDNITKELTGTYTPIANTGKYIIIVPPGKYDLEVESEGFPLYTETITVLDKASFQPEIKKDIFLKVSQ